MASSPLSRSGEQAPETARGHGTGALGPSDSSDSGSDVRGGPAGARDDEDFRLDTGTSEDATRGGRNAGVDLGDAELDGDSDSRGTGERSSAGREPLGRENNDLMPDHVEAPGAEEIADEIVGDASLPGIAQDDEIDGLEESDEERDEADDEAEDIDAHDDPAEGARGHG